MDRRAEEDIEDSMKIGLSREYALCQSKLLVVVIKLPQTPDDDPQKRESCVWKADMFVTVGA